MTSAFTHAHGRRVAVAGCGEWGRNIVRNFHELGALGVVCDRCPDTQRAMSERYGVPGRSFPDILEDDGIDCVAITAPAEMHATLTREALAHDKHVFVEKPLALNATDAKDLCAMAEARGRCLMVGHLLRYHPAFRRLAELVQGGGLGRLQYIYSNRLNLGRFRREENALWDFAPHDISMILALVGAMPEAVWAIGAHYFHKSLYDVTTSHLAFPDGINAHIFVSWLNPFKDQKLVVVGEAGMAVFEDSLPGPEKLLFYPHTVTRQEDVPSLERAEPEPLPYPDEEPLKAECQHFLDSVTAGSPPRTDGREGARVLTVLEAAQHAMETGHRVCPPAGEAPGVARDASPHPAAATLAPDAAVGANTRI